MPNIIRTFALILAFPLLAVPALAQEREIGFLGKAEAAKLVPKQLLEYKLVGFKIKKKSDEWQEYSATYKTKKGSPKELKLVINDALLKGRAHWETQLAEAKKKTQGHPSKLNKSAEKNTVMVFVGNRFRVDFKSTSISPEKLQAMKPKDPRLHFSVHLIRVGPWQTRDTFSLLSLMHMGLRMRR